MIVERYIPGNEHRVLVVGGKVVAAARGEPAWVTGDGSSSLRQLVATQLNADPRRGTTEAHPLNVVDIDNDGDLDILSIGWGHDRVLLYETRAVTRANESTGGRTTTLSVTE